MKKFNAFNVWFIFVFIANLVFLSWHTEYKMVSKPLIVASLIGFYIANVPKQSPAFLTALIFALLGDIFLMIKHESFFLIGLGCFLLMQILYMTVFLKDKSQDIRLNIFKSLPAIFLAGVMMYMLWGHLGAMRLPVLFYTMAIGAMVISASIRKPNIAWYIQVVIGVALFMASDAGIAINKFASPFPGADYFIMSTYMAAQYLIVRGVVEREHQVNNLNLSPA